MAQKKNITFENIGELFQQEITVLDKETGEEKVYKTVDRAEICTIVAYMLGIEDETLDTYYSARHAGDLEKLRVNRPATTIRYLCRIRTAIMRNFLKVDNLIRYEMKNLDRIEYFHPDEIQTLRKWGIEVLLVNSRSEKYMEYVSRLIDQNIDACSNLFPEYVNFRYIRDAFLVSKYTKTEVMRAEYEKYNGYRNWYPFQAYLNWEPEDKGNILQGDGKFLGILYQQHGDSFSDRVLHRDAVDATKQSIYDFIDHSNNVAMVVDCENCDPYKLYGVLKNLNENEVEQIRCIILYDDYHTTIAWDYLERLLPIPVIHKEVERVADHKSLVDISMAVGVSKAHLEKNIDSFILCSSDSDFWGLISSLDTARFLVLYEYDKCGAAIKEALAMKGIFHCSIDDFYRGNATDLQSIVLKKILQSYLPGIIGENAWELTRRVYADAYIEASPEEMKRFYEKVVKAARLKLDDEGRFYVELP